MDSNITLIVAVVIAVLLGVVVVRKVAGCLIRSVLLVIIIAILAFLYFHFVS